jgi:hypothetical protein
LNAAAIWRPINNNTKAMTTRRRVYAIKLARRILPGRSARSWPTAMYVHSYDPDARDGEGVVRYLDNVVGAKTYPTITLARREVERRSTFYPRVGQPLADRFECRIVALRVCFRAGERLVCLVEPENGG